MKVSWGKSGEPRLRRDARRPRRPRPARGGSIFRRRGPDEKAENLRCRYETERRILEEYLGWRDKVMRFTFTTDAALTAMGAWMYDRHLGDLVAAPFALAALI